MTVKYCFSDEKLMAHYVCDRKNVISFVIVLTQWCK